ncbi:MAG TPA: AMP-binding protein [Acidimicrobiia bacterium]|jgi:bile acid-coenzyme A ligase|nr:AMP-binding protein [Acidimicrobiia bacterium]
MTAVPMIPYPRQLANLATADPTHPAVTDEHRTVTRAELERLAIDSAEAFAGLGVGQGDIVVLALPNSVEFIAATIAAWKVGATPTPVSSRLPKRELDGIIELAKPALIVGVDPADHPGSTCLPRGWVPPSAPDADPRVDTVSDPWKGMTSGGSTGRPKLILNTAPALIDPEAKPLLLMTPDGTMVMPGPLYHNGPFMWSVTGLLAGNHVVLGGKFDAEGTLQMIDEYRPECLYVVPTMMARISKLPADVRARYDVSSLNVVWHLGAPCPPWLKEAWIEWIGPQAIWELYAGTEAQASTLINGTEWLEHRGSVGRPLSGEMKVVRADGTDAEPGEVGEIFMRPSDPKATTYTYVGAEAKRIDGGWESLGDMGSIDADGYVYLADRQTDMILAGGSNVYPAEVESALDEHPRVRSSAVIGLPDDDLGSRIHAIVHTDDGTPIDVDELRAHLGERLVRYKIPRDFEFTDEPLRDDAGKIRRSALRAARLPKN